MFMKTLFRRRRSLLAGSALAVMLTLGLVAVAPQFSSPASAQTGPSCADPVTSAPTGPATVSAALTPYGKVLVVGSGGYAGCSLYLLTSDQLHALTGAPFACSDNSERDWLALRHCPVARAPHQGCPHRGAGGEPQASRDGDPHRPARSGVGTAGDLRRAAVVPVLPGRDARGRRKGRICSTR